MNESFLSTFQRAAIIPPLPKSPVPQPFHSLTRSTTLIPDVLSINIINLRHLSARRSPLWSFLIIEPPLTHYQEQHLSLPRKHQPHNHHQVALLRNHCTPNQPWNHHRIPHRPHISIYHFPMKRYMEPNRAAKVWGEEKPTSLVTSSKSAHSVILLVLYEQVVKYPGLSASGPLNPWFLLTRMTDRFRKGIARGGSKNARVVVWRF